MDSNGDALAKTFAHFRDYVESKKNNRRAGTIAVFLNAEAPCDFIHQNVMAAFIVRRFPGARVFAMYREADDGRNFAAECNPYFHNHIAVPMESPVTIPLDWFDIGFSAPVQCPDPTWKEQELDRPDLFLTPKTLSADIARVQGLAENPPGFRIPAEKAGPMDELLERATGADRRWFACICLDGSQSSTTSHDDWRGLARHVGAVQGGRVVCVGPADTAMPAP
ncbi:MAG: hypothetical protein MI741_09950, partial [Rhodospirillales bacterium]|nr:hypothetical protein [Rhodospirillales bacterium]